MREGNEAVHTTTGSEPPESAELKQTLKHQAKAVAEQAQSAAESGKQRFVAGAQGVAQALENASEGMREGEQQELARYTQTVARKIEQVAQAIGSRDLPSLVDDVKRFAQRQPALFLGGAFTAGLIGARFLKSTAGRPPQTTAPEPRSKATAAAQSEQPAEYGPAQGGYGPVSSPDAALGGHGIFGPDATRSDDEVGQSALTGEKLGSGVD